MIPNYRDSEPPPNLSASQGKGGGVGGGGGGGDGEDLQGVRYIHTSRQRKQLIAIHNNAVVTLHPYHIEDNDNNSPSKSKSKKPLAPSMSSRSFFSIDGDRDFAGKTPSKYFANLLVAHSVNSSSTSLSFVDSRNCFAFLPSIFSDKLLYLIHGKTPLPYMCFNSNFIFLERGYVGRQPSDGGHR